LIDEKNELILWKLSFIEMKIFCDIKMIPRNSKT
jgi:hypothetical protein